MTFPPSACGPEQSLQRKATLLQFAWGYIASTSFKLQPHHAPPTPPLLIPLTKLGKSTLWPRASFSKRKTSSPLLTPAQSHPTMHPGGAAVVGQEGWVEEGGWSQGEPGCEWWSCQAQLAMPPWTCGCSSGVEGPAGGSSSSGQAHCTSPPALSEKK